ncbi:RNA nucleotidyltransferase, partial [bacterium]
MSDQTPPAAHSPLELLDKIRPHLQAGQQVYLVGGAVRDLLRQRNVHDLDFAASGDVRRLARRVANA